MKNALRGIFALAIWIGLAASARADITVRAQIDGESELVISEIGVFWDHLAYIRPGLRGGDFATFLNGISWFPDWPDTANRSAGSSNRIGGEVTYEGPISIQITTARGPVTIAQLPLPGNDNILVINFNDRVPSGAAWYEITIVGVSFAAILPNCPLIKLINEGNALDHGALPANLNYEYPVLSSIGDLGTSLTNSRPDGFDDFLTVSKYKDRGSGTSGEYHHIAIRSGKDGVLLKKRIEIPKSWNNGATYTELMQITFAAGLRQDLNNDGIPEFAVGTRCASEVYGSDCNGRYGSLIVYDGDTAKKILEYLPKVGHAGYYAGAGDIDRDGTPDLLIGDPAQKKLYIKKGPLPKPASPLYITRAKLNTLQVIDPTTSPTYGDFLKGGGDFCFDLLPLPLPPLPLPIGNFGDEICIDGKGSPLVTFGTSITVLEDHLPTPENAPMILVADSRHGWLAGGKQGGGMVFAIVPPGFSTLGNAVTTEAFSSVESVAIADAGTLAIARDYTLTVSSIANAGRITFADRFASTSDLLNDTLAAPAIVQFTIGSGAGATTVDISVSDSTTISDFVAEFNRLAVGASAELEDFGTDVAPSFGLTISAVESGVEKGTLAVTVPAEIGRFGTRDIEAATDAHYTITGKSGVQTSTTNVLADATLTTAGAANPVEIELLSTGTTVISVVVNGAGTQKKADIKKIFPDVGEGHLGYKIENAGDLDEDGYDDAIISTPGDVTGIAESGGTATVMSGRTLKTLRFQTPIGGSGTSTSFDGYVKGSQFGYAVSGRREYDGDKDHLDFGISAPGDDAGVGMVRIFSGYDKSVLYEFNGTVAKQRFGQGIAALNQGRFVIADKRGDFYLYALTGDLDASTPAIEEGFDANRDGVPDHCQTDRGTPEEEALAEINRISGKMVLVLKSMRLLAANKSLPTGVLGILDLKQNSGGQVTGVKKKRKQAAAFRRDAIAAARNYMNLHAPELRDLLHTNNPKIAQYHSFLKFTNNDVPMPPIPVPGTWTDPRSPEEKKYTQRYLDWKNARGWTAINQKASLFTKILNKIQIGSALKIIEP